jgi:hypothetical protein
MLCRVHAAHVLVASSLALGAARTGVAAAARTAGAGGIAALARGTATLPALHATPPALAVPAGLLVQACGVGTPARCYDTGGASAYLNVGLFFDSHARSTSDDLFLKYFTPPGPGRHRILSLEFVCNTSEADFAAAGALATDDAQPTFPSQDDLNRLQRRFFRTVLQAGQPTCVDLGDGVVLEAGQGAWLVLQWADGADSVFVASDADGNDRTCDFLSRDGGDLWYRPDPRSSPYDWEITAYYEALPTRPQGEPWSVVKRLYR